MLLKLIRYDFVVGYCPGKDLFIADTLSRAYIDCPVLDDPELSYVVHSLSRHFPITDERRKEFQQATEEDEGLKAVKSYFLNGWPNHKSNCHFQAQRFWNIKDDIHVQDDLVFFECRLIVPKSLQKFMLNLIHESHFGMTKCKTRARELVYWVGMNRDIEEVVSNCEICQKYQHSNCKEPLLSHSIPDKPWSKVVADILTYGGRDFLVVMDYFSKWIELFSLESKSSTHIIDKFKKIFSRLGIPDVLIADNNPFSSYELKIFSQNWGL